MQIVTHDPQGCTEVGVVLHPGCSLMLHTDASVLATSSAYGVTFAKTATGVYTATLSSAYRAPTAWPLLTLIKPTAFDCDVEVVSYVAATGVLTIRTVKSSDCTALDVGTACEIQITFIHRNSSVGR